MGSGFSAPDSVLQAFFRFFLDGSSEGVLLLDEALRVLDINAMARTLFGLGDDDSDLKFSDLLTEHAAGRVDDRVRRGVFAEWSCSLDTLRRDGVVLPVDVTFHPLNVEGQHYWGVLLRDTTARRLSELALQRSESRFRDLIEQMPDGIVVHRDGRFRFVNPALVDMLHYPASHDLLHRPILDILHPDDREASELGIREMLRTGLITSEVATETLGRELPTTSDSLPKNTSSSFVQASLRSIAGNYPLDRLRAEGLSVLSTADPRLQSVAERTVRAHLDATNTRITLLAMEPKNGAIRALVSSDSTGAWNDPSGEKHPLGSALMPVVAAIPQDRLTPTARSLGLESFPGGFRTIKPKEVSASVLELARACATLANGGLRPESRLVEGIQDQTGRWLERFMPHSQAVLSPDLTSKLAGRMGKEAPPSLVRAIERSEISLPLATNTGTDLAGNNGWALGFTPELATAVWTGRVGKTGPVVSLEGLALEVWSAFMAEAHGLAIQPVPQDQP